MDNNARGVEHLRENGSKCRNISFEVECSQIFRLFFFDPHPLFSLKKSVAESLIDLILDAKSHYKSQNLTQIERQIMEESDSSQENIIYQSDTGGKNQEIICHGKGKAWEEYNMERKFLEGFILW